MSMSDLSRKKIAKMIKCRVDARGLRQQLAFAMSKLAASKVGGQACMHACMHAGMQAGRRAQLSQWILARLLRSYSLLSGYDSIIAT